MDNIKAEQIKEILIKTGFTAEKLKTGATGVFINGRSFSLYIKKDKLIAREAKKLFPKKYVITLTELSEN